jgi:4-amino-4-deoxy-L-arabinose transferase-like glycosyltransferase
MARSGDWITPRLDGKPWFEKPALLYWMTATAYKAGLDDDLAPRVPVAIVSVAFLIFFFGIVRSEFGEDTAAYASAILATSAGWLAYGQIAVPDMPLAATFSAAMLLCLRPGVRRAAAAGVCLGLAVLAKGLVPLVLAAPLLWKRRIRELLTLAFACLVVAAPWYVLCTIRNGYPFLQDLIVKQHFSRFTSDELAHVQAFWYYLPVLLGAVFPWTPLLASLFRREVIADSKQLFLVLWVGLGFVFFSIAPNKLPGYLLPLLPAIAILIGIRLVEMKNAKYYLMAVALLMMLIPVVGEILPRALLVGLRGVKVSYSLYWAPLAVVMAFGVKQLEEAGRRRFAIGLLGTALLIGVVFFKTWVYLRLDATYSARYVWRRIEMGRESVCVGEVSRNWIYGLNFYAGKPLPPCSSGQFRIRLIPGEAKRPIIVY